VGDATEIVATDDTGTGFWATDDADFTEFLVLKISFFLIAVVLDLCV
jgi:hypothetical protein